MKWLTIQDSVCAYTLEKVYWNLCNKVYKKTYTHFKAFKLTVT